MILPEDYIVVKFYQYAGGPERNKYNNTYQGSCPMCREGSSWLRKKRFYFIPKNNRVFCHNCGYSKNTLSWIMDVTGLSISEIKSEIDDTAVEITGEEPQKKILTSETLPKDCINLFDDVQLSFYRNNKIVQKALQFLEKRMLNIAINRPKAYYLSLTDKVHKNRLVIPFYDENGKILYYQSRTILEADELCRPRYLSKIGSDKIVFNINNIDTSYDKIFIFEGPLNSTFVKNGVAVGGIQENSYQLFTARQQEEMDNLALYKRIWVLDSQWKDKAAFNKTKKLLELKESVFIWPEKIGKLYKDFNDIAIALKSGNLSPDFILKSVR
jgi:5'(3')-deoxyribonucleotidase